jgi:hypothetical protein
VLKIEISTMNIFSEIKTYFSISYKVDLLIRRKLNESILSDLQLKSKDKDMCCIDLVVSTSRATIQVEVKGPQIYRKDKTISWGLWLPYEAIVNTSDQLIPYLKYYFDAVVLVFENYRITEDKIRVIQKSVEEEVLNNRAEYVYEEEDDDLELDENDLAELGLSE